MPGPEQQEKPPITPEAPKVERAPEVPKGPETPEALEQLGAEARAEVEASATEAKNETAQAFEGVVKRVGIAPETAASAAQEAGVTTERGTAEAALDKAAREAQMGINAISESPREKTTEIAPDEAASRRETEGKLQKFADQARELLLQASDLVKDIKNPAAKKGLESYIAEAKRLRYPIPDSQGLRAVTNNIEGFFANVYSTTKEPYSPKLDKLMSGIEDIIGVGGEAFTGPRDSETLKRFVKAMREGNSDMAMFAVGKKRYGELVQSGRGTEQLREASKKAEEYLQEEDRVTNSEEYKSDLEIQNRLKQEYSDKLAAILEQLKKLKF